VNSLQVLIGDIAAANATHREFFAVWKKYGVIPERYVIIIIIIVCMVLVEVSHFPLSLLRYLLDRGMIHPTERYYPLRPELAESTFYLYQATKGLSFFFSILEFTVHNHSQFFFLWESTYFGKETNKDV
jgi:mannosidase alpha-like ER degradation enhancer 1